MPRYRGTVEPTPSLVGRLLLFLASGEETSGTLAEKLGVSSRQINRYITHLNQAGWQIERRGAKRKGSCRLELVWPQIVKPDRRADSS